jgi:hypothetical protein
MFRELHARLNAPIQHLDLDLRSAAGRAVAGAGRHQPLQRGDGLPTYVPEETPQANGTILRRGCGKAAGFALEWEEKPYEWIHGGYFRQARVFAKGPVRRFPVGVRLGAFHAGCATAARRDGNGGKMSAIAIASRSMPKEPNIAVSLGPLLLSREELSAEAYEPVGTAG